MKENNQENILRKTALLYLSKGWCVVPVHSKSSLVAWEEFQSKLPTKTQVKNWFFEFNNITGVAIVCGKVSGVVVLDVDIENGADESLLKDIPKTVSVATGKGKHYYFKYSKDRDIQTNLKVFDHIELRSNGTYVVAPPSKHINGKTYEWINSPDDTELSDVPEWLINSKQVEEKTIDNKSHDWERIIGGVDEGERNTASASLIGKLLRHHPTYDWKDFVWPMVQMINDGNNPPIEENELRNTFESLVKKESLRRTTENSLSQSQGVQVGELKLDPIKISDLLDREMPEIQWTIYQLLPEAGLAILSAPPSHHKTWLALYFAIQVAKGEKVFDMFATKKCNILFIEEDTSDRLITLRIKKLMNSSANKDLPIHFMFRSGLKFDDPKMMDMFIDFIKKYKIGFVIFDSLIQFHTHDENVNKDMALVFTPLKKMNDLGISVLVLHHHRKESGDEDSMSWRDRSQSLRGASMILSLLNSHLVVSRQSNSKSTLRQTKLWEQKEMDPLDFELVDEGKDKVISRYS